MPKIPSVFAPLLSLKYAISKVTPLVASAKRSCHPGRVNNGVGAPNHHGSGTRHHPRRRAKMLFDPMPSDHIVTTAGPSTFSKLRKVSLPCPLFCDGCLLRSIVRFIVALLSSSVSTPAPPSITSLPLLPRKMLLLQIAA